MSTDAWNPQLYHQFRDQRGQPFRDLVAMVQLPPGARIVDLGCGTGELTRDLHQRLAACEVIGVDSSEAMLEQARSLAGDGLHFQRQAIESFDSQEPFDLIFSNAALHWAPDHERLLARLTRLLAPHGQLAVQVPAMHDQPSHQAAHDVARRPKFSRLLNGFIYHSPVLRPKRYAELLYELGYKHQQVRLVMYSHLLPSADAVVDWLKGTTLTVYQSRLSPDDFTEFVEAYRQLLHERLPQQSPYLFVFQRILFWAQR
jgi:trans-aconitate 2-methyltransferase